MTRWLVRPLRSTAVLLMATVVAFAFLAPSVLTSPRNVQADVMLADSTIYTQGSLPCCGVEDLPIDGIFLGTYGPGDVVVYPRTNGWLNGLTALTTDKSVALGVPALDAVIKQARIDDPDGKITVVTLSQGTIVASHVLGDLQREDYDTSGITFVLAGDPVRPNGGLAARLPFAVWLPIVGVQGDFATPSTGVKTVMITKRFDPFADAPRYLGNPFAFTNWVFALGYAMVGGAENSQHFYDDVDPSDPNAIVRQSGNMTDIVIPVPVGDLPLTKPFKGIVPQKYINAADPVLRALIMTGYDSDADPAVRASFGVLPPVSRLRSDIKLVADAAKESADLFVAALKSDLPKPMNTSVGKTEAKKVNKSVNKTVDKIKKDVDKVARDVRTGLRSLPATPAGKSHMTTKSGHRDNVMSSIRKHADSVGKHLKKQR